MAQTDEAGAEGHGWECLASMQGLSCLKEGMPLCGTIWCKIMQFLPTTACSAKEHVLNKHNYAKNLDALAPSVSGQGAALLQCVDAGFFLESSSCSM